ncbi:hypothetical protein J2D73_05090 [Acetobacter sacchari]|uniref:Uncharacterized protein n=1 Tax=Acetobacter sacchari TaxID=2661687 RepID=A0ABS3LTG1_9PROT|nr:hypothetical protein [Acetobacter sacchari]MBO1359171.1 hypothetical protein [Acetobacter sacchari]
MTVSNLAKGLLVSVPIALGVAWCAAGDTSTKTPLIYQNANDQFASLVQNASSVINQPNGIAGLDGTGNVTVPLRTTTASLSVGGSSGQFTAMPNYGGTERSAPVLSIFQGKDAAGNDWDVPRDLDGNNIPWSKVIMLGGQRADNDAFLWHFGQPVAGGLQAVVDAVYMNGMAAGQGSGVTAGQWWGLVNYGELDAVAREERTGSAPPKFVASSAIKDPSGNTHTVTFTATGASFSPALPAYWAKFIVPGMNIVTNERAVALTKLWQNNWLMSWLPNTAGLGTFMQPPNTWMGTISSWTTNPDGTVSSIQLDTGWAVYFQKQFLGSDHPTRLVPGQATADGSPVGLDTIFSNISAPAILFGVYTKAFPNYQLCEIDDPAQTHGDINAPNGQLYNQVHQCANEWDFVSHNKTPYAATLQGLTVNLNGDAPLANDSFGFLLQGGGAAPMGYVATNMAPNAPTFYAPGPNGWMSSLFAYGDLGQQPGSFIGLLHLGFAPRPGANYAGSVRFVQYRDTMMSDNPDPDQNTRSQSVRLMYTDADGGNSGTPTTRFPWDPNIGNLGGQIIWNPSIKVSDKFKPFFHGIGIAAGGSAEAPNYGLIVDNKGNAFLGVGGQLNFLSASGQPILGWGWSPGNGTLYDNVRTSFVNSVQMQQGASIQGDVKASATITARGYIETLTTPSSSSAACTRGQFTDDADYHYVCVAANHWKRVALSNF